MNPMTEEERRKKQAGILAGVDTPASAPTVPAAAGPYPIMKPSGPTTESQFGGVYTPETPTGAPTVGPIDATVQMFKDSATATRTGTHYNDLVADRASAAQPVVPGAAPQLVVPAAPQMSVDPKGLVPRIVGEASDGYPQSTKASYVAPPVVRPGRDASGVITAESAKQFAAGGDMGGMEGMKPGQMRIGDGGYNQADQNERMARSLGYAGTDDFNKQFKERSETVRGGVTTVGEIAPGVTKQDAINAGMKESDVIKMMVAQGMHGQRSDAVAQQGRQQSVDPMDARKKQLEVGGMEEIAALRTRAIAGDKAALSILAGLSGKSPDYKDRYIVRPNRKVYDKFGQVVEETPGTIFDAAAGIDVPAATQGGSVTEQANAIKAAVASGVMPRDEAISKLKALGLK